MDRHLSIADVVGAIADAFPPERAEPWDRVGLLAGDPRAALTGVAVALDADAASVSFAAGSGANLLLTHHPAWLDAPDRVIAGPGAGGLLHDAVSVGVALACAHTNLDRTAAAQRLMPERLGFEYLGPLERGLMPMSSVTVFVPPEARSAVAEAMAAAGAGRLGAYEGCSFTGSGHGRFTAREDATPRVLPEDDGAVVEDRLEMMCPSRHVEAVVSAAVSAHRYEEPLVIACDAGVARNSASLGALSRCDTMSLDDVARRAASAYGVVPRVWGSPDRAVSAVATATGSGGSLVGSAVGAGADVLIAGEVRYHDATAALASGLCVIEVGHDVSEWPLVELLADAVRSMPGADGIRVTVMQPSAGWWTP